MWWAGERLRLNEIALVAYSCDPSSPPRAGKPALGAAATNDEAIALRPDQFGNFLHVHREAELVCYDAAALHWLLEGLFQANKSEQARERLWQFSREARLVDVMLLDQHVRRWHERDRTQALSLQALAKRCEVENLPDDQAVQGQVEAAWQRMSHSPEPALFELLLGAARSTLQIYQHLRGKAEEILAAMEAATIRPAERDPSSNPWASSVEALFADCTAAFADENARQGQVGQSCETGDAAAPTEALPTTRQEEQPRSRYGLLGVGIDVQAAIALRRPDRPGLKIDLDRWPGIKQQLEERYRAACERLFEDRDARKSFEWTTVVGGGKLIVRNLDGLPIHNAPALKSWLRQTAARLCNADKRPAEIPITHTGDPSFDPERWGIWADCDRVLGSWRDMDRAAQLIRALATLEPVKPIYDIMPTIRSREPNLSALRDLGIHPFRPNAGTVFVVGRLQDLRLRSFAAVCKHGGYSHRNHLAEYLLLLPDPIGVIAKELYALMECGHFAALDDPVGQEDVEPNLLQSTPSLDEAEACFVAMETEDPETNSYYRNVATALLETLPLGLPESLLAVILQNRYDLNTIGGVQVKQFRNALQNWIIYELRDYLEDDIMNRLAGILGVEITAAAVELVRKNCPLNSDAALEEKYIETSDSALRNDLLDEERGGPVWQYIREVRLRSPHQLPPDDAIIDLVLNHRAKTIAGRLISPASPFEVRRQQCRLVADEAMKSVAHALVERGYVLLAVGDDQFVLEIPQDQGAGAVEELNGLVHRAQEAILGQLAAPCLCVVIDHC